MAPAGVVVIGPRGDLWLSPPPQTLSRAEGRTTPPQHRRAHPRPPEAADRKAQPSDGLSWGGITGQCRRGARDPHRRRCHSGRSHRTAPAQAQDEPRPAEPQRRHHHRQARAPPSPRRPHQGAGHGWRAPADEEPQGGQIWPKEARIRQGSRRIWIRTAGGLQPAVGQRVKNREFGVRGREEGGRGQTKPTSA